MARCTTCHIFVGHYIIATHLTRKVIRCAMFMVNLAPIAKKTPTAQKELYCLCYAARLNQ